MTIEVENKYRIGISQYEFTVYKHYPKNKAHKWIAEWYCSTIERAVNRLLQEELNSIDTVEELKNVPLLFNEIATNILKSIKILTNESKRS